MLTMLRQFPVHLFTSVLVEVTKMGRPGTSEKK